MNRVTTLIFAAFLSGPLLHAQLVNIESRRMQTDSVRFATVAGARFNYSDQNGDTYYSIGSDLTTQFKSKHLNNIFFLLGSFNLVRAEGTEFQNTWFLHARYNRKLSGLFRVEAFVQYQKNELLVIDSRFLTGAGIRLKFLNKETLSGYLGNSILYEVENSQAYSQRYDHFRNSTYVSLTFSRGKDKIHLVNTIYFQPLYTDFTNHRILEQFLIEQPVSKALSITVTYNYALISVTPADVRDYSSIFYFGLSYAFPPDL